MAWNELWNGDCVELLADVPAGSADLVFADPPFNIGFEYDVYKDKRSKAEYLSWTDRWLAEVRRVLAPDGSVWVAIGDEYAAELKVRLDGLGLVMRNWCIWHYTFGVHATHKFGRDHAHLLYYVADPERFVFNADAVRVPSARQTIYDDARADPRGRVPGDVWSVSRLCGTFKERTGHPCQMPEEILERIVKVSTNPNGRVVDPFAGSGTTLAVAKRLGRRWLGMELSADYCRGIEDRLADVRAQLLV